VAYGPYHISVGTGDSSFVSGIVFGTLFQFVEGIPKKRGITDGILVYVSVDCIIHFERIQSFSRNCKRRNDADLRVRIGIAAGVLYQHCFCHGEPDGCRVLSGDGFFYYCAGRRDGVCFASAQSDVSVAFFCVLHAERTDFYKTARADCKCVFLDTENHIQRGTCVWRSTGNSYAGSGLLKEEHGNKNSIGNSRGGKSGKRGMGDGNGGRDCIKECSRYRRGLSALFNWGLADLQSGITVLYVPGDWCCDGAGIAGTDRTVSFSCGDSPKTVVADAVSGNGVVFASACCHDQNYGIKDGEIMLEWVREIAIFLVISGLILEMMEETKYYKFARWVVGTILILQLLRPLTEAQNLWERFQATLLSFDYALGSEKVLEEIYSAPEGAAKSVLSSYKASVSEQVEKILNRHGISLLSAEMEIAEDGEMLDLYVLGEYRTEPKEEGVIAIPTVIPIGKVEISEKEKKDDIASPMEVYLGEVLAEFYRIGERQVKVVIQEATE